MEKLCPKWLVHALSPLQRSINIKMQCCRADVELLIGRAIRDNLSYRIPSEVKVDGVPRRNRDVPPDSKGSLRRRKLLWLKSLTVEVASREVGVSVVEAFWVRPQRIYVNTGNGM